MGEKKQDKSESKQALYRRYRSMSFDEVVGQEHVTDILKQAVTTGTVSHAYLFTGPRGTGKTSVARILAFAANDLPYQTDSPHLDIIEIDAASNRRIDDIRDLREKVHIAPVSARYKVYIIDEVHMLTGESFNALLKTLEEPPAHAIFILATTELHKVPATIVSRTQRFAFRPISKQKVIDHLAAIAKKENIPVETAALEMIADHGGGSFRDSISLLDQLGGLGQEITVSLVESILGRAGKNQIEKLVNYLETKDGSALNKLLGELAASGVSPVTLAEELIKAILMDHQRTASWYSLADQLMNVARAHFPQLLLTSTLLQFAARANKTMASRATVEEPVAKTEKAVTIAQQAIPSPKQTDKVVDKPKQPPTVAKITNPGEFNWDKVLNAAKKSHAPLSSVLARATMTFDGDKLTLAFQYVLHRKKLEQPMYRTQLARLIEDVCHVNPEIVITSLDEKLTENDVTRSVADIMGGGEVVSA